MTGPYETERQAADAVRHILDSPPGTGAWQDGNLRLLEGACRSAEVQLGAYDEQILVWLAGYEPWTCAVVAGLISRAHQAGTASIAARVAGLAGHIEARLSNERADRQTICEDTAAQLRALAGGTP